MQAYCINLDNRLDRREYMWSEFSRLGIEVERVSAVDGTHPSIAEKVASLPVGLRGNRLGTGAYACFASHRICWQKLVDSGNACAMVLEDDLIIADSIVNFLTEDWLPPGVDIARLETYDIRIHLGRVKISVGPRRHLSRLRSTFYGTGCYVISQSAASRLLELTSDFVDEVDRVIFDVKHPIFSKIAVFQMCPAPAIQGALAKRKELAGTWSRSSIRTKSVRSEVTAFSPELTFQRIGRRLYEEVQALFRGTRYVVVPHG